MTKKLQRKRLIKLQNELSKTRHPSVAKRQGRELIKRLDKTGKV